ncbi:MAG TPA: hypothetical protein VMV81_11425, partial [Phycisphaerae bacterium]|nr:hypothetical protein [Phycisphaerae bacterium]
SLPVDLKMADGKRLVAREVFFDQKRGLAHIEGAGSMSDDRKTASAAGPADELAPAKARKTGKATQDDLKRPPKPKKPQDPVQIAWSRGVDIEIGSQPVERINPNTGLREQKQKEFLRRAWFHGNVDMHQGTEQLTADEVAATFASTGATDQVADQIQHLNMTGRVRLQREGDIISADHLDIEMTMQDGRNIPRVVDAIGDAMAQQGERVIRADHMHVTLGMSTVKGKTVVQGDMLVQESKPRLGVESIDARGRVYAYDPENQLKIRDADQLLAAIEQGSKLVHATIDSLDGQPHAKVRAGETAIHGQHIDIDVPAESVDVPGPGKAWMMTEQDFGGRKLAKPTPVRIAWSRSMQMRGLKNYGVFIGDVHSKSDAFSLACDKLTVRLAESQAAAPKTTRTSLLDQFWLTRAYRAANNRGAPKAAIADIRPRKRPTNVVADGNAEVLSSTYAVAREPGKGRLLSRMQVVGPQVVADLVNQRMSVPGKGSLLLEDYQFNSQGQRSRSSSAPRSGPLMSSAQGEGPSQTVVFWDSSMDYYLDQNLVAFDQNVDMRHLSGRQMVMKEELVAGMGMDPTIANELREGRKAQLTAGYLLLQFKTAPRSESGEAAGPPVRATDLEKLVAKHKVFLQVDTRTLMGEYVQYSADIDEVQVEGSKTVEARIFDEGENVQRYSEWRGPLLIWNRRTNAIEAPQANIRTSRR